MEWIIAASVLWGATTPLIRRGSLGVEDAVVSRGKVAELVWLATRWQYIAPLALNFCGSLAFVRALQTADLALASPLTNALALMFTWLMGWALGENVSDPYSMAGVALVALGSTLCVMSS
ncbi:transmembrane protein 234-like protein [Blastocladiella britannica]|nr:transmembrane protein 234-like protein [Blastocladiella britannica]